MDTADDADLTDPAVVFAGALRKQCAGGFGYNERWLQLTATHLHEYRHRADPTPKAIISLERCLLEDDPAHKHSFIMNGPFFTRPYYLRCRTEADKQAWLTHLQACIDGLAVAPVSFTRAMDPAVVPAGTPEAWSPRLYVMSPASHTPSPRSGSLSATASPPSSSLLVREAMTSCPTPTTPSTDSVTESLAQSRQLQQQLAEAVRRGDLKDIDRLLALGAEVNGAMETPQTTALHLATSLGHYTVAVQLLQHGASAAGRDWRNATPLHAAVAQRHAALLRCLLDSPTADVDAKDVDLDTALHVACRGGVDAGECVDLLLAAQADVAAVNAQFETPLHCAAHSGAVGAVHGVLRRLRATGRPVPPALACPDAAANTPLHRACGRGHAACVEALLRAGAPVDRLNGAGKTAADLLQAAGPAPCSSLLLRLRPPRPPSTPSSTGTSTGTDPPSPGSGGELPLRLDFTEDMWRSGKFLGRGSYGEVRRCLDPGTGRLFVAKQLLQRPDPETGQVGANRELHHLQTLRHPNVVRFLAHHVTHPYLYLCLEYVEGGSLLEIIERHGRLEGPLMQRYTRQILVGLQYLHQHEVLHRDIKPANLLVSRKARLKLADFGGAKQFASGDAATQSDNAHCTPAYAAPEIYNERQYYKSSDIWSVGCTVLHMATGVPPWATEVEAGCAGALQVLYKLRKRQVPAIPARDTLLPGVVLFIEQCVAVQRSLRPTCDTLLDSHPFLAPNDSSASEPVSGRSTT